MNRNLLLAKLDTMTFIYNTTLKNLDSIKLMMDDIRKEIEMGDLK